MTKKKVTEAEKKDTALALILILLLMTVYSKEFGFLYAAIGVLILAMTWLAPFAPLARLWFGLSHFLGLFVPKIVLSVVYFLIVMPIGFVLRLGGKDLMRTSTWKKASSSVMTMRNHRYSADDLEKPF